MPAARKIRICIPTGQLTIAMGDLLQGLFNKLWNREDLLCKIQLVEGDITQEDVGIHPDDKDELLKSTHYVIHSAAAVALDDPIKKTLRNNYVSTFRLLELCKKMPNLRSYSHVSTAYVNITFGSGSVVKEKVYPLVKGDRVSTISKHVCTRIFYIHLCAS